MTATEIRNRIDTTMKAQTTRQLVGLFEYSESPKAHTLGTPQNIADIRGWIMDELEARNAEKFEAWLDSLSSSPRAFYL